MSKNATQKKPPFAKEDIKQRWCMLGEHYFKSSWIGDRICVNCKQTTAYTTTVMD